MYWQGWGVVTGGTALATVPTDASTPASEGRNRLGIRTGDVAAVCWAVSWRNCSAVGGVSARSRECMYLCACVRILCLTR